MNGIFWYVSKYKSCKIQCISVMVCFTSWHCIAESLIVCALLQEASVCHGQALIIELWMKKQLVGYWDAQLICGEVLGTVLIFQVHFSLTVQLAVAGCLNQYESGGKWRVTFLIPFTYSLWDTQQNSNVLGETNFHLSSWYVHLNVLFSQHFQQQLPSWCVALCLTQRDKFILAERLILLF